MRRQTMIVDLLAIARRAGTIETHRPPAGFLADTATLPPETAMLRWAIRLSHWSVEPKEIA
jgi:hypothetical protein